MISSLSPRGLEAVVADVTKAAERLQKELDQNDLTDPVAVLTLYGELKESMMGVDLQLLPFTKPDTLKGLKRSAKKQAAKVARDGYSQVRLAP